MFDKYQRSIFDRYRIHRNLVSALVAILLTIGAPTFGSDKSLLERKREQAERTCEIFRGLGSGALDCAPPGAPAYDPYCERNRQRDIQDEFFRCIDRAREDYENGLRYAQTEFERRFSDSLQLVTMLEGQLAGGPVFGSGIIVGFRRNRLYVVTANHIVRRGIQEATNLKLLLRTNSDRPLKASLEKQFDMAADVAIVAADGLKEAGIDCKRFCLSQLGDLAALTRKEDVYPVGNPNGVAWGYPVAPDKVSEVFGGNITFQSSFIAVGHSGGALINGAGLLVGMILKDAPPFGVARSLTDVITKVREWGVTVDLERPEEGKPDRVGSCQ